MKRLYRSDTKQQIAGVCAGIAEYFNLDITLVRLVFVLMMLAGGPGLLVYIIMWIVAPIESEVRAKYPDYKGHD